MPPLDEVHQKTRSNTESYLDLRRRSARDLADTLVGRAAHLPPQERALLLAVYAHGRSMLETAQLLGESHRSVRTRVHQLVKRVMAPHFLYVVRYRADWTPSLRAIATECFIHGRSVRQAAKVLGFSYHVTRRGRDHIDALSTVVAPAKPTARHPALHHETSAA